MFGQIIRKEIKWSVYLAFFANFAINLSAPEKTYCRFLPSSNGVNSPSFNRTASKYPGVFTDFPVNKGIKLIDVMVLSAGASLRMDVM